MAGGVAGQVRRYREGMRCASARRRHRDGLAADELLTGKWGEEFDELERAAGVAVNFANAPEMKGGLGRGGERDRGQTEGDSFHEATSEVRDRISSVHFICSQSRQARKWISSMLVTS